MIQILRSIMLSVVTFLVALQNASAVTIETVPVGDIFNANDPATGNHYGGVNYDYRIAATEVTVGQYTDFLNAVAATDTYELYSPLITMYLSVAGIARSGVSGSYTYSVIGSPNHPISCVTWGDAARFSNWLQNGQPVGAQSASTTEDGAYTLNGAISSADLNAITRNPGATWFIPSESEWYKAAYYNPANHTYYQYPTSSNTAPTSAPPGSTPNTANIFDPITGFAVTGTTSFSDSQNYLTDVGAYTASASPYGTFDQGGNLFEWNEARGDRGGSWNADSEYSRSSVRFDDDPNTYGLILGFRVASVPEPSTFVLAALGAFARWAINRRRHN